MEAMLARAFALVGKGCTRPLNLYFQASASPGRRTNMPLQLRHLHRRPAQPDNPPEEQHQQQNHRGGAPSRLADIPEQNWSMQHNNITVENSADPVIDSIRDTVEGSFDHMSATLKSIGKDRVREYKLELLLKKKPARICYVWCDPSLRMHISEGILKTIYVNKMVKSGCKVKILIADWFARMNRDIGGNLNKMQSIGLYNIEMWKAAGMALDGVELVWLSDEISRHADEYWPLVMDIARKNTVTRLTKSHRIRDPLEVLTADEILRPCLQCASILFQKKKNVYNCWKYDQWYTLKTGISSAEGVNKDATYLVSLCSVDIWLLSIDLHDAASLATQYCNRLKRKNKPIAVLHNMPPSLLQYPEMEIKKYPGWYIFMEDDEEAICRKIEHAFCPPNIVEGNPCLGYIRYVILPWFGKFEVVRKKENGGNKTFLSMEELTSDYVSGALHPSDVKLALAKSLNKILQPVRDHFGSSAEAKDAVEAIRNTNC